MAQVRQLKVKKLTKQEATRRHIQHKYLQQLQLEGFSFALGAKDPYGVQGRVLRAVNECKHEGEFLNTNKMQVSEWCRRVRQNGFEITSVHTDYSSSSQNARKFHQAEQERVRKTVLDEKLKSGEVLSVFSDKAGSRITISPTSTRRILKRKLGDQPSLVAAVPKAMKRGGSSSHHNRCRLHEAEYWLSQGQGYVDRMFFGDESKIRFREHKNSKIDIEWVLRGEAEGSNWYECPRWPGQVNLFILQSRNGIELFDIYDNTMKKKDYVALLPKVEAAIRNSHIDCSVYLHDNVWRDASPTDALNRFVGPGKWTQYMGKPCTKPHATEVTPVRKIPTRVPLDRCHCDFPDGPVHAAFNPKLNLVENTFAQIDRVMTQNKIADERANPPRYWIRKGAWKTRFWKRELKKAIEQLNENKQFFKNQYKSYLTRCKAYLHRDSRGKRLKTSKY